MVIILPIGHFKKVIIRRKSKRGWKVRAIGLILLYLHVLSVFRF